MGIICFLLAVLVSVVQVLPQILQFNNTKHSHTPSGFFACCSIKLIEILNFKKAYHVIPEIVDSSNLWDTYKPDYLQDDITYHFFIDDKQMNSIDSYLTQRTPDFDYGTQYRRYQNSNYRSLLPYIMKYFTPSKNILHIKTQLLRKYDIDTDGYCAVYYRGTDKVLETQLGSFESFNAKLNEIISQNESIKILIQTDSTQFLEYMKIKHSNILAFDESITSISNKGTHYENSGNFNYKAIQYLFATVLIMSKCKYIVCSSGNVPSWIMQYRGNGDNVHQYSQDRWI
mmetsp:Transcript_10107/g.9809  ORF Transcript_10107/g.9809 Transcript_10107/m.9809 type:complete len:286 (+) Transcript_10107:376-1233(+)